MFEAVENAGNAQDQAVRALSPASSHLPKTLTEDKSLHLNRSLYTRIQDNADTFPIDESLDFFYKHKHISGKALHVAAMYLDGTNTVERLLRRRADPREKCHTISYGKVAIMEPVHLAAGTGSSKTMMALLEHKAILDAKTSHGDIEHFCALHEAAFHGNLGTAKFLLDHGATVNCVNMRHQTPLHVAAKSGSWLVAKALVNSRADVRLLDQDDMVSTENQQVRGKTALGYAIVSKFPDSKLSILSSQSLSDVRMVANLKPRAAKALLNLEECPQGADEWRKGFLKEGPPSWEDLVVLIRSSPSVAVSVLQILTVQPPVQDEYAHPLPQVLPRNSTHSKTLNCEYQAEQVWKFSSEAIGENFPAWHTRLAPIYFDEDGKATRHTSHSTTDLHNSLIRAAVESVSRLFDAIAEYWLMVPRGRSAIQIRMLQIPNVVQVELLFTLSDSASDSIFQSTAAQAIVDFCWTGAARMHYSVHFVFRVCELAALLRVAFTDTETIAEFEKRASWSFLCCCSVREICMELMQAFGYIRVVKHLGAYVFNPWNHLDFLSVGILAALVWKSLKEDDLIFSRAHPELLATVSFFRWVQILYMLRAYAVYDLGYKIIPIFMSFFRAGEIFLIACSFFLAFTHAFCVINVDTSASTEVFLNTFRLLFLSDGDGIDYVLNLGGHATRFNQFILYVSVVGFCICILNLFIAVHGSAYDHENHFIKAKENFYVQRARICLSSMLQPKWPFQWPPNPHRWYVGWMLCGICVWIGLLCIPDQKAASVVSALVLYLFAHGGDRSCLKRQWERSSKGFVRSDTAFTSHVVPEIATTSRSLLAPYITDDMYLWWVEVNDQDSSFDEVSGDVDANRAAEAAEEAESEIDALGRQVAKVLESLGVMSKDIAFLKEKMIDVENEVRFRSVDDNISQWAVERSQ